jgi:AraC family transcriptional regulator, regulatory protein of adaptative response / methylated-DNA-[protein]-cysteine methyltransferase
MTRAQIHVGGKSLQFSTDEDCWAAILRRDPHADGVFYYSVQTTGIYCRPTCPSRLPLRGNVHFHADCAAAELAGYRPCKRCRPSEEGPLHERAAAVAKACRLIERAEEMPNLDQLASEAGMTRFHFHRVFKATTGVTPRAYAAAHRAARVRKYLPHSATITNAIYEAGFASSGRFYAESSQILGMTPSSFRSGGHGAAIRFAVGECSLGSILVAATDKGICALLFGDDPGHLVRDLQDQFPEADLVGADEDFEKLVARVVGFVEAPQLGLDLPLDVQGTAFQQRVWQALRQIPTGQRMSYSEIARLIDAPKAVRAVAQACAANQIAVAIPCHRVVRHDGKLGGYRWGVERKLAILEREASR